MREGDKLQRKVRSDAPSFRTERAASGTDGDWARIAHRQTTL